MIVAIDAGNSRIKWGCYLDGNWQSTGAVSHEQLQLLERALQTIGDPERIVISNVAGEEVRSALTKILAGFTAQPEWITAQKQQCGVLNHYEDPAKLGSDRWAALIAAHHLQPGPLVVVNAGTALTVDALTGNGEFLGGLIVPGIQLMMRALTTATAHAHAEQGEFVTFPRNTLNAVYSGALNAALGSIQRIAVALTEREGSSASCMVSGGAAETLLAHIVPRAVEVKHLVLRGLVELAESTT
jgi:type III pantothenate kinase